MSNLESKSVLYTLQKLLNVKITDTPIGQGLILDPRTAFLVSSLSGSAYLENSIYPFSTRGLLKIVSSALEYRFITGIYDGYKPKYSPILLSKKREYLFKGNKIFVPVEIENENHFRKIIKKNLNRSENENILVLKIDKSKKGYGMEPYLEMISSFYFSKNGYITETQVPLDYKSGSPDFMAIKQSQIQNENCLRTILPSGFNIIELSMIRMFPSQEENNNTEVIDKDEFLIGEAKTESATLEKQIQKYVNYEVFENVIEIHNNNQIPEVETSSLLSVKENNVFFKKSSYKNVVNKTKQTEFSKWFSGYCKLYLLSNFTFDEINQINKNLFGNDVSSEKDLINIISEIDINKLIKLVLKKEF